MRVWAGIGIGVGVVFGIGLLGVLSESVTAESSTYQSPWTETIEVTSQTKVTSVSSEMYSCSGLVRRVYIQGYKSTTACVFGEGGAVRVARYSGEFGYVYAVSLYDDTVYTKVENFCLGMQWCVYGGKTDTMLMQVSIGNQMRGHTLIKDFSKHLMRHESPHAHYSFEFNGTGTDIRTQAGPVATGSAGVSTNGEWALVELREHGFVRVNMKTGQYKRVSVSSGYYGHGYNPSYELAISNDGQFMVTAGSNVGITLRSISDECGEALMLPLQANWLAGTIPCKDILVDWPDVVPGLRAVYTPRFVEGSNKLIFFVSTSYGLFRTVVAPSLHEGTTLSSLYVALGDSFVSGEGETDDAWYRSGTNTKTNKCHISLRSYPYLLHPILPIDAYSNACSGARIEEVTRQSKQLLSTNTSQRIEYISVGVGGNNIDVMGKLKTCLGFDTCEWALPERRSQTAREVDALLPKLTTLFSDVKNTHPQAHLFIVGYPEVINSTSQANCGALLSPLLNETERQYINETIGYLNHVLMSATEQAGVQFIDVSDAYQNYRLCDASPVAMNSIRFGDDIAPIPSFGSIKVIGAESFHPTPKGHEFVAEQIRDSLRVGEDEGYCEPCTTTTAPVPTLEYWESSLSPLALPRLIADTFLNASEMTFQETLSVSFGAGSFQPFENVQFELHSTPQTVAVLTADDTGAVQGTLVIPKVPEGYHTVHAIGASFTGESIDRYQVVHIGEPIQPLAKVAVSSRASLSNQSVSNTTHMEVGALRYSNSARQPIPHSSVKGATTQNNQLAVMRAPSKYHEIPATLWYTAGAIVIIVSVILYMFMRRQV